MTGLKSRDVAVSAAAVRVLCGLLHHKSVDPEILDAAGAHSHTHDILFCLPPWYARQLVPTMGKDDLMPIILDLCLHSKHLWPDDQQTLGQGPVPASYPRATALEERLQSTSNPDDYCQFLILFAGLSPHRW